MRPRSPSPERSPRDAARRTSDRPAALTPFQAHQLSVHGHSPARASASSGRRSPRADPRYDDIDDGGRRRESASASRALRPERASERASRSEAREGSDRAYYSNFAGDVTSGRRHRDNI